MSCYLNQCVQTETAFSEEHLALMDPIIASLICVRERKVIVDMVHAKYLETSEDITSMAQANEEMKNIHIRARITEVRGNSFVCPQVPCLH
jgi:hypothetical protein